MLDIFFAKFLYSDSINAEEEEVRKLLRECIDLRSRYVYKENVAPWTKVAEKVSDTTQAKSDPFHFEAVSATKHHFKMEDGVVRVYASKNDNVELFPVASATTFFTDMHHILKVMSVGNVRTTCYHRLRFLEEKFRLHLLVNADREFLAQKGAPHRDFYNIRKVDTHVHHSACMNQKHLLRFIKSKLKKEPDEVVIFRDGLYMTLKEVFESLDLTGYDLNVDLLDVHADKTTFHRFDKFNLKYNPCGQSRLREIFLKQDNLIQGRFLAEVTKEVLADLEASKYQMAEYRISIYGRKQSEWDQLASWFVNNQIYSENAVWLIQLPRLYNVYKEMGIVNSFQNILDNVFLPLFEVTVDPNSHPQLHMFLMQVVGFDLVDDESKPERRPTKHMPKPAEWTNKFNPAYSYYTYYCYANLYTLNKLRESKGLRTIKLRPHCGEAGDIDHLAAAFLLCENISHGINLRKSPALQYLYYLAQVGLAMSPLSNNSLFLDYHRNPFPIFFQRGMNVSLSTDDPLQIQLTKEPLVEEYSVAAKVWKLSSCDLCEIARNSVYQSGFSHAAKEHWLGSDYYLRGPEGNNIHKTNVPNIRVTFRHEVKSLTTTLRHGRKRCSMCTLEERSSLPK
ncbi:AMP deaminase [Linum perenne]